MASWHLLGLLALGSLALSGCGKALPTLGAAVSAGSGGMSPAAGSGGASTVGGVQSAGGMLASGAAGGVASAGAGGVSGAGATDSLPDKSGHPVAILRGQNDTFGAYFSEILRAEGFSSFDVVGLGELERLPRYELVILSQGALEATQATALASWVNAGGRLIAMRPGAELSELFGLEPGLGSTSEGYLQVPDPAWGIASEPLQFHGVADLHRPASGVAVAARLLDRSRGATSYPALTVRSEIGPGHGVAAAFAFDVSRSVVFTRQGDPARAGQSPKLDVVPRASEFFDGYLDVQNFAIPQADEQQRLLVNLLLRLTADRTPLPRLWYLPGGRKLTVVMTGDDHNAGGSVDFFNKLKAPPFSPQGCSVKDWTCARATSWVYSGVGGLKNGAALQFAAQGFEVGPHVAMERDGGCATWSSQSDLAARFTARRHEFEQDYGMAAPPTNRSHCFVFPDWDTQPKVEQSLGIRLDENYTPYALPGTKNRLGRLNGSALPMRFADTTGSALDIYQLVSDMDYEYFDSGASSDQMRAAIAALFDGALGPRGFCGFVGTHYDYSGGPEANFEAALLAELTARATDQVSMISARQLLDWLDLRNGAATDDVTYDGQTLRFRLVLNQSLENPGLEVMLPRDSHSKRISVVALDGHPLAEKRRLDVRGVEYVSFGASSGSYAAIYQ